jgi:DNA-binding MarR family transcriptional regulator
MSGRSVPVLAWLRLVRVMQKISAGGELLMKQHGLNGPTFGMLSEISADEGLTQQELSANLLVTKGNVSQLLERLEENGLVYRQQEGTAKRLFLTEKGRELVRTILPEHDTYIGEQLRVLTPEEQTQLLTLLRKVDKSLD